MSGILEQCLSEGPKIQLLHEDKAARSIVVSNISPTTADAYGAVIIHFQRERNGGGEIEGVYIPKKGIAVIAFESREGL